MCNRVQGPPDLCATVCNYESDLCATNWPPSCWPAFPPLSLSPTPAFPQKCSERFDHRASPPQLLWPSLEASDRSLAPHGWLLRQWQCAIAAVFALAGWLSQEGSRANVNSCSMYFCVTFSHYLFGIFFQFFSVCFLLFCIRFCLVHPDPFSQLFCTLHLAQITRRGIGDSS